MQNIEESQETKVLDTSVPKQDQRQDQLNAKFSKERSLQQYYEDCNFESEVNSFSDFMQSQLTKRNRMLMPEGAISEPDFGFYNKGKELWAMSYDLRDDMEDLFRHQLETSDRM